jgi:hypothetical protein|tara:strand:+ start:326 stop:484 length:159 start_codon:yes stop_codon:yes gene_type:complete
MSGRLKTSCYFHILGKSNKNEVVYEILSLGKGVGLKDVREQKSALCRFLEVL